MYLLDVCFIRSRSLSGIYIGVGLFRLLLLMRSRDTPQHLCLRSPLKFSSISTSKVDFLPASSTVKKVLPILVAYNLWTTCQASRRPTLNPPNGLYWRNRARELSKSMLWHSDGRNISGKEFYSVFKGSAFLLHHRLHPSSRKRSSIQYQRERPLWLWDRNGYFCNLLSNPTFSVL